MNKKTRCRDILQMTESSKHPETNKFKNNSSMMKNPFSMIKAAWTLKKEMKC